MEKEVNKTKKGLEKKEMKPVEKKTVKNKVQPKISRKNKNTNKSKAFNIKEIKIEAEFDDGEVEVEIKTPTEKIGFTLNTTDKVKVLSEISKRTGINITKLNKIVEFEEDD